MGTWQERVERLRQNHPQYGKKEEGSRMDENVRAVLERIGVPTMLREINSEFWEGKGEVLPFAVDYKIGRISLIARYEKPIIKEKIVSNGLSGEASFSSSTIPVSWSMGQGETDISVLLGFERNRILVVNNYFGRTIAGNPINWTLPLERGMRFNSSGVFLSDDQLKGYIEYSLAELCRVRIDRKEMLPDLKFKALEKARHLSQSKLPRTG